MSDFDDEELSEIFFEEASSTLTRLAEALVELEASAAGDARTGLIREIFRHAHTLKGAASSVGRDDMAEVSHALESRLDALRKHRDLPLKSLIDAALKAVDVLSGALTTRLSPEHIQATTRLLESGAAPLVTPVAGPAAAVVPVAAQPEGLLTQLMVDLSTWPRGKTDGVGVLALVRRALEAPHPEEIGRAHV